ncbi:hypothetical protein CERSUDRAFT_116111 [Gelatoporia subvermispora B]|uniref:Uncharacterized protein n=1 Tax=Ceriporiopsis subvermispora (strain B) TaxID=914234 RepID=M2R970_CERS8|nr:hypothetical protein CERSUDRAFT_116111 [Gelatoporia subvermispora B]
MDDLRRHPYYKILSRAVTSARRDSASAASASTIRGSSAVQHCSRTVWVWYARVLTKVSVFGKNARQRALPHLQKSQPPRINGVLNRHSAPPIGPFSMILFDRKPHMNRPVSKRLGRRLWPSANARYEP